MLIRRLSLCTSAAVLGPKRDPEKSTSQSVNQSISQPVPKIIVVYLCGASAKHVYGLANLFSPKKVNQSISQSVPRECMGGVLTADSGIDLPTSMANNVCTLKNAIFTHKYYVFTLKNTKLSELVPPEGD